MFNESWMKFKLKFYESVMKVTSVLYGYGYQKPPKGPLEQWEMAWKLMLDAKRVLICWKIKWTFALSVENCSVIICPEVLQQLNISLSLPPRLVKATIFMDIRRAMVSANREIKKQLDTIQSLKLGKNLTCY